MVAQIRTPDALIRCQLDPRVSRRLTIYHAASKKNSVAPRRYSVLFEGTGAASVLVSGREWQHKRLVWPSAPELTCLHEFAKRRERESSADRKLISNKQLPRMTVLNKSNGPLRVHRDVWSKIEVAGNHQEVDVRRRVESTFRITEVKIEQRNSH